jgi:hypothetical protein
MYHNIKYTGILPNAYLVVKALGYKMQVRGFDTQWGDFKFT